MKRLLMPILFLTFCLLTAVSAQATEVIRNGAFDLGLSQWNKSVALPATWSPLSTGAVDLHPPAAEYHGDIIFQNLNVTGIANTTFAFSCALFKTSAPSGKTVAVYADYLDNAGSLVSQRLVNPDNASFGSEPQSVTGSFTFPATAVRLVKLRVAKEDYGEFTIDNLSFTASGIAVGTVPAVTSLSSSVVPYGGQVTLTGSGFGASAGAVSLAGSSNGVTVGSWSDTEVTITVVDPARSGHLVVQTADKVESDNGHYLTVTSPNFTSDLTQTTVRVMKGQAAELVVNSAFLNGFTTAGITFTASGLPGGTTYSFSPVPLTRPGGVVLTIDTATLSAGSYDLTIQASSPGSNARTMSGKLIVTAAASMDFLRSVHIPDPPYYQQTPVTSPLSISAQGDLSLTPIAYDADGMPYSGLDLAVSSSNPSVVGVYKNAFGYQIYAHNEGSAIVTATAPDGTQKTLTVNVSVPSAPRIDISLSPAVITNKYADYLNLSITYSMLTGQTYGSSRSAMTLTESTLGFNSSPPFYSFGGHFKVDQNQTPVGTYMFSGSIGDGQSTTLASNTAPLTITNDPSYAGLNLTIKSLDPSIPSQMYEYFDVEFRDPATGNLVFKRSNTTFVMGDDFFIGAVLPGTYKVCVVPLSSTILPNCYPNGATAAEAQSVTFTAGSNASLYFFAKAAPDTTPPTVSLDINGQSSVSATALTVSGINVSAYDASGIAAYCLSESSDPASCSTWTDTAPTSFTFAAPGTTTLYAFAKDLAGNTGVSSKVDVTITLYYQLSLQFAGTGIGTVNGDLTCTQPTCAAAPFALGTTATLMAAPNADSTFQWSGCTGVNGTTCTVTMDAPKTVTLTFTPVPPTRIQRTAVTYPSIMSAYGAASSLDVILVRSTLSPLQENLNFAAANSPTVTLRGGLDRTFASTIGVSTVKGTMRVSKGKVIVNRLKLRP